MVHRPYDRLRLRASSLHSTLVGRAFAAAAASCLASGCLTYRYAQDATPKATVIAGAIEVGGVALLALAPTEDDQGENHPYPLKFAAVLGFVAAIDVLFWFAASHANK